MNKGERRGSEGEGREIAIKMNRREKGRGGGDHYLTPFQGGERAVSEKEREGRRKTGLTFRFSRRSVRKRGGGGGVFYGGKRRIKERGGKGDFRIFFCSTQQQKKGNTILSFSEEGEEGVDAEERGRKRKKKRSRPSYGALDKGKRRMESSLYPERRSANQKKKRERENHSFILYPGEKKEGEKKVPGFHLNFLMISKRKKGEIEGKGRGRCFPPPIKSFQKKRGTT